MDLMKSLEWLNQAKMFITENAPNALEKVSEIALLVSDAAKNAADWFKSIKVPPVAAVNLSPEEAEEDKKEGLETLAETGPGELGTTPTVLPLEISPSNAEKLKECKEAFENFQLQISDMAETHPLLLRATQKDKAKTMIPGSFQVSLAKLISTVTDHIVDKLDEVELPNKE